MRANQRGECTHTRSNRGRIEEQRVEVEPGIRVIAGLEKEMTIAGLCEQLDTAF